MDGNKKIAMFVFAGIVALSIAACKVQSPRYVSLYLDNSISVNDTIEPDETPLDMADTGIAAVVDSIAVIEAELPVLLRPAEDVFKLSTDSVHKLENKELPKATTDSIHLLRHQMIELQNQLLARPDTNFTVEKIQRGQPLYGLQPEVELKQYLQTKNDTIEMLRKQVFELRKPGSIKADTVYITKEIIKQLNGDIFQTDYKTSQLLQAKNDTIDALRKQPYELQNTSTIKTDTVYVIKETAKSPVAVIQQPDHFTLQLLRAKDEQIQMLQNQLIAMQIAAARTPQPTRIIREPKQVQPLGSQQYDHLTLQLMQANNDTIQLLRSQLYNLQLRALKKDTVIIEEETKETQPAKELVTDQKTSDLFKALQDTIRLLKTRVLSLEEQPILGSDTSALATRDEKDIPYEAITDTTLLVAFYGLGEIKPLEEESILQQIEELSRDKNVTKITLSGYTDSSGNEIINKEITTSRINYLSDLIIPWIAKEKVFFQNFGDTFASDMVVSDERRIEIRIHTK